MLTPKKGFIEMLSAEIKELLKHPKKLLPTAIIGLIWIVLSIISTVGVNVPMLRFLNTLTYANGGMFGGFFGTIGGIFGKAVFAAVVNGLVLSICSKQNPFKGIKGRLPRLLDGGVKAISTFMLGGGIGILLYFFFNITSSAQNCAIAIVAALAGVRALASQNGLIFSGAFWLLGKLTKGKTPSKVYVSRFLSGLSAGFAISFPITFLRLPVLIAILGVALIAAGIFIPVLGKRKAPLAGLCLILVLSAFSPNVYADDNLPVDYVDPATISGFSLGGNLSVLSGYDGFYLVPEHIYSGLRDNLIDYDFYYSGVSQDAPITVSGKPFLLLRDADDNTCYVSGTYHIETTGVKQDLIDYSGYSYAMDYSTDCVFSNMRFDNNRVIADYSGFQSLAYSSDQPGVGADTKDMDVSGTNSRDDCIWKTENGVHYLILYTPDHLSNPGTSICYKFRIAGVLPGEGTSSPTEAIDDEPEKADEPEDVEYVLYNGKLTYTNGRVNNNGQPFPDLMDFDGDGEITWLDSNIQRELSHDPDYLDRPDSKGAGVAVAILTAILGAAAGTLGGTIGGAVGGAAASAAAQAASGIAEGVLDNVGTFSSETEDLGPYITRDSDGDLNVKDPATGEERLYKANGDGTYTNPLTGATYSEGELKDSLGSRAENATAFRQDETVRKAAVESQRKQNKDLSQLSKEIDERGRIELEKMEEADKHNDYVEKLEFKYDATGKELKKTIMQEQINAEVESNQHMADEAYYKAAQKTAESTEKAADIAIDALAEIGGEEGQLVKDAYSFTKATMARGAEAFAEGENIAKGMVHGAIEGSVEVAKNHADGAAEKLAANVSGDMFKAAMENVAKGENADISKVVEAGGMAAINTSIDVGFDMAGDLAGDVINEVSDDIAGSVADNLTKMGAEKVFKVDEDD